MSEACWKPLAEISDIAVNKGASCLGNADPLLAAVAEVIADVLPTASASTLRAGASEAAAALAAVGRLGPVDGGSLDFVAGRLSAIIDILGFAATSTLDDDNTHKAMQPPYSGILRTLSGGARRCADLALLMDKDQDDMSSLLDEMLVMQVITNHPRGVDVYFELTPAGALVTQEIQIAALATHIKAPNAAHLRDDLDSLVVGGRFTCGGEEWIVTDIGTRTLTAIKIDDKAKADPSWLQGPVYALAETSFDEEDIKVIALV